MSRQSVWTDLIKASFTQGYLDAGSTPTRYWSSGYQIHIDFLLGR